ncbi:hypothetical protein D3C85_1399870 [compost metagenome]
MLHLQRADSVQRVVPGEPGLKRQRKLLFEVGQQAARQEQSHSPRRGWAFNHALQLAAYALHRDVAQQWRMRQQRLPSAVLDL